MYSTVPAVVEFAITLNAPTLLVLVYAPVALMLTIPFVATAPVVAEVKRSKLPLVSPVPVDAIDNPTPVVNAFPETLWIVPAAVESANTVSKPILLVLV